MRLSESILIGSVVVKARPGTTYRSAEESGCAIGMAIVGAGGRWRARKPGSPGHGRTFALQSWWPWTNNHVPLPCYCKFILEIETAWGKVPFWKFRFFPRKLPIKEIMPHLFDKHVFGRRDWTIEQLAQWVASVEPGEGVASLAAGEDPAAAQLDGQRVRTTSKDNTARLWSKTGLESGNNSKVLEDTRQTNSQRLMPGRLTGASNAVLLKKVKRGR